MLVRARPAAYSGLVIKGGITDEAWEATVKNILRGEMVRRGATYEDLVAKLAELGVNENVLNLRNKISRGRFTAPFFAQCMVALGVEMLQIPRREEIASLMAEQERAAWQKKRPKG